MDGPHEGHSFKMNRSFQPSSLIRNLKTIYIQKNSLCTLFRHYVKKRMDSTMGLCRMGGNTGFERVFPCIRLRGLPFHATEDDIRLFLVNINAYSLTENSFLFRVAIR